jgi:hypothetical protein
MKSRLKICVCPKEHQCPKDGQYTSKVSRWRQLIFKMGRLSSSDHFSISHPRYITWNTYRFHFILLIDSPNNWLTRGIIGRFAPVLLFFSVFFLGVSLYFNSKPAPAANLYKGPSPISTSCTMSTSETKAARRAKFDGVFTKIRDELVEHFAGQGMPAEAIEWYRNVRFLCWNAKIRSQRSDRASTITSQGESSTVECLSLIQSRFSKDVD